MALPKFQSEDSAMNMLQTQWASQLDPLLAKPLSSGLLLKDVELQSGNNTINHRLGRKLQGWIITRMQDAFAQVYDKQSTNQMTDKTLILNSNGAVTVDLMVF